MSVRTVLGFTAVLLTGAAALAHADGPVPLAFKGLKPFQIVEQVMVQRQVLGLTEAQVAQLADLSFAIQNEQHRFVHKGGKPHETRHVPMVSRSEAYTQALAILTPDQRVTMQSLFPVPAAEKPTPRKRTVPHGKP